MCCGRKQASRHKPSRKASSRSAGAAWPRDTRFAKRSFTRLDRAYVDARYSPAYEIAGDELAWLADRVKALQDAVADICAEHLAGAPTPQP
jgi:hypothetical protein